MPAERFFTAGVALVCVCVSSAATASLLHLRRNWAAGPRDVEAGDDWLLRDKSKLVLLPSSCGSAGRAAVNCDIVIVIIPIIFRTYHFIYCCYSFVLHMLSFPLYIFIPFCLLVSRTCFWYLFISPLHGQLRRPIRGRIRTWRIAAGCPWSLLLKDDIFSV